MENNANTFLTRYASGDGLGKLSVPDGQVNNFFSIVDEAAKGIGGKKNDPQKKVQITEYPQLVDDFANGQTVDEIAARHNISNTTVRKILNRVGNRVVWYYKDRVREICEV